MSAHTNVLTVTQLNTYVKSILEGDRNLQVVYVQGEISNFTDHYRSGHLYFSLKDSGGVIKAVMFAGNARRLRFKPEDGMKVLACGRVSLYEVTGQYQFYVNELQPVGAGALAIAFEQLKNRLEKEGLFEEERKKALPRCPERIGVVTSPTGAAVRDILNILSRRWPLSEVILCPVLVQGEEAAPQIAEAIARFNREKGADVLIVGRGGGSIEDLWAFNEECVARAVAESKIPIISAVGHETDFTICDFVADLRAPTPSAAAELAVPDRGEVLRNLLHTDEVLRNSLQNRMNLERQKLDRVTMALGESLNQPLEKNRQKLSKLMAQLDALSPLKVLGRGYAVVKKEDGAILENASEAVPDEILHLRLKNGALKCRVLEQEQV
jgi:exodeoxyribonuclease VII large subunit